MAPPTATVTAPSYPKLATVAVLRSKVFILNRHKPRYKSSVVTLSSSLRANPMLSSNSGSQGFLSSTGARCKALSALSSPFLGEDDDDLWRTTNVLPLRSRSLSLPRAYKDDVFKFRYPVITEKPEWWLRTLACVPYLLALQISDAGYFLHPFLEHYEMFENLIYFVPGAIKRLPPWFSMIYCYFGYIGIVKNKDWPHYIRFHLMMGMLLETALQLIWYTSNFLPLIHYNGCFGMHYWAGIGFGYILVLFECVRCALGGRMCEIYCYFGYAGIVKNKALSRYIRIHLMMGMLLETAFKLIWYTGTFLPLTHFNGHFMMHFWAGFGIGYIFVLLECVRCALGGKCAHIPVISNAAYIHTRFNVGGLQRPF